VEERKTTKQISDAGGMDLFEGEVFERRKTTFLVSNKNTERFRCAMYFGRHKFSLGDRFEG